MEKRLIKNVFLPVLLLVLFSSLNAFAAAPATGTSNTSNPKEPMFSRDSRSLFERFSGRHSAWGRGSLTFTKVVNPAQAISSSPGTKAAVPAAAAAAAVPVVTAAVTPAAAVPLAALPDPKAKVSLADLLGVPEAPVTSTSSTSSIKAASSDGLSSGTQNFSKTLSVDPRSGGSAVAIPLYIPEGRGGVSPSMGLTYSSAGGNGQFGWGWNMELGSVVRSTKNGTPKYDSTDTFIAVLGGKSFELVNIGGNEYRSKYDDDRVRFFLNSGVWSAKDKSGTMYYFGSRAGSTVNDGATKVFKWRLDRVEDLFGNVMVTDYAADGSFEVRYGLMAGKNSTTDVNDKANFAYVINAAVQSADRADVVTDYKPGFAVSERRLVDTITIRGGGSTSLTTGGNVLKKYNFTYAASAKTGRSLLKGVTETGADGVTSQPVVNLRYNDTETAAYTVNSIADPLQGDNLWNCRFTDYDHDRLPFAPPSYFENHGPWGPTYTQVSGNWGGLSYQGDFLTTWSTNNKGNLSSSIEIDHAVMFWTYLYMRETKTISIPYISSTPAGVYLNANYDVNVSSSWSLKKGYNLIEITLYSVQDSFSFLLNSNIADSVDLMNSTQVLHPQLVADFNGDGKTDAATYFTGTGTLKVALSNGTGFLPKTTWIDGFAKGQKLVLGDFNGDGRTDVAAYDTTARTVRVALSDGTRFVDSGIWLSNVPSGADVLAGDFNGDGRTDLYMTTKPSAWQVQIAQSTGTAFTAGSTYTPQVGASTALIIPADMNGDGLTDLIGFDQATGNWSVNLNTNGFGSTGVYSVTGFGANKPPAVADYNQDGQVDIGYFDAASKQVVYRPSVSNGVGAQQTQTFNFTLTDPATTLLQTADFNGDGVLDFMTFNNMGRSDIAMSNGKFQDLLTSYDNGFGGALGLAYSSSADLANNYLPFAIPVISSVTATNNQGDSLTTSYSYSGGYWNPIEREMYGFKEARTTDADGNYSLTRYNQDNLYMRGRPDRTVVYGADNKLYQETTYQWTNDPVIAGRTDVRFVSQKRVDNFVYDTTSASPANIRTAQEYGYDITLGIPTEVRDYGQVDWASGADTGNDYIRTVMTYGSNTTNNVLGILTSKISYDGASNVLGKSYAYYDGSTTLGDVTRGLVTRSDVWNKVNGVESLVSSANTYNSYGQLLTSTDPLGNKTSVAYDTTWSMFPLVTTNAKGFKKTSAYYGVNGVPLAGGLWGLPQSVTDINNQVSTTTYDTFGRVIAEINPLDSAAYPTTTYEYQTKTNYRILITRKRVEHGQAATLDSYAYVDGFGRTLMVKTPSATAGKVVVSGQSTLNNRGLVVKQYPGYFSTSDYSVLELPNTANSGTSYEYDALGRRVKVTLADGAYATSSFTPTSATSIDPNGHKTTQVTDVRGRVIRIENYTGATGQSALYPAQAFSLYAATLYNYDLLGNLLTVTDAKGNVTTMTYDALGRKLTMNDPDMHNVSYEYDALGQLTKQTDAKNIAFAFTYDVLGRPVTKARADTGMDKVTYVYDATGIPAPNYKGRLALVRYPLGLAGFVYDALGQEIRAAKAVGGSAFTVDREYDALGRMKYLNYSDHKTSVVYGYNMAGQLNTVTMQVLTNGVQVPQSIITGIDYEANGNIKKITYGNGAVAAYVYDPVTFRLLTQAVVDTNSVAVQYNGYTYDPLGNIIQVEDKIKNTSKLYTYDALSRMISSKDGADAVIAYQYDELGNIRQKGNLAYTYAEGGAGPHAVTSITDGTSMTYDANGNMASYRTAAKTQYYTYDTYNRLIMVEAQDVSPVLKKPPSIKAAVSGNVQALAASPVRYTVAEYAYDGDGGRTKKTVYVRSGDTVTPVTTSFVGDLIESTNGIQTNFIFLGSSRVAAYDGAKVRWFVGDHLGSTSVVLDETSAIKEKITYTPWGEVKSYDKYGDGAEVARFYFTGKKLDDESGLYYFGARYYNPRIARFITPDTIVQSPFNPQTLNRHSYCNNNPVNLVDPTGHKWKFLNKVADFFTAGPGSTIMSAVGVVLAPVTGGASLYLAYAGMALGGVQAYNTGGLAGLGIYAAGIGVSMVTAGVVNQYWGSAIGGFFGGGIMGSTLAMAATGGIAGSLSGAIMTGATGGSMSQIGSAAMMGGVAGVAVGGAVGYSGAVVRANAAARAAAIANGAQSGGGALNTDGTPLPSVVSLTLLYICRSLSKFDQPMRSK